jgi:MinD superfamily P-loop ATPase
MAMAGASAREIVVVSGKGGTGKTSIAASFALLAGASVVADCDVDAADLHLILDPAVRERRDFFGGREAVIREAGCTGCEICLPYCRFDAIRATNRDGERTLYHVDPLACEGCGVCVRFCPEGAIDFPERRCGVWMVSDARSGPMVHARLDAGGENSGKLVSTVRREARRIAGERDHPWIIVDGPPGIGCPVIASITGAWRVLAVTEPTVSGEHDLERVLSLARHFQIPARVCLNKWDLNPAMAERIERRGLALGARPIGRVPYDPGVTRAQMGAKAVVEIDTPSAEAVRLLWQRMIET